MHLKQLKFLVISLVVLLAGCKTTSISNVKTISIPQNLTPREAKIAVAASVSQESKPDGWKNWEKMTDAALSAAFGFGYQRQHGYRGQWYVESIETQAVIFGYTRGNYYIRVRMNIETGKIVPIVEDSNGLRQSESSIHKAAIDWINRLEILIRSSLGAMSAYKASSAESQS